MRKSAALSRSRAQSRPRLSPRKQRAQASQEQHEEQQAAPELDIDHRGTARPPQPGAPQVAVFRTSLPPQRWEEASQSSLAPGMGIGIQVPPPGYAQPSQTAFSPSFPPPTIPPRHARLQRPSTGHGPTRHSLPEPRCPSRAALHPSTMQQQLPPQQQQPQFNPSMVRAWPRGGTQAGRTSPVQEQLLLASMRPGERGSGVDSSGGTKVNGRMREERGGRGEVLQQRVEAGSTTTSPNPPIAQQGLPPTRGGGERDGREAAVAHRATPAEERPSPGGSRWRQERG